MLTASAGIGPARSGRIAVERQHRRVGLLGPAHGARLHDRVVLLEQRPARGDVRGREQREQRLARRRVRRERRVRRRVDRRARLLRLQVIQRAVVDERPHRHVADELARRRTPASGPSSVTVPIAAPLTSHFSHSASTASTFAGSTTHSIRSCDSLTITSNGSMSGSRSGTFATSRSIPTSPLEAISAAEEVSPAAPRSCSATISPRSSSSSEHSSSFFSSNGSPTCTVGRLSSSAPASPSSAEASTDAPPIPSRPVARAEQHERVAGAGGRAAHQPLALAQAERHRVDQAVLLVRPLEVDLAADRRHADRVAVVADARDGAVEQVARACAGSGPPARRGSPKRSESSTAIGRAPIAKMSRRMPPDARRGALERLDRARVVVRLDLERAHQPAADVDRAGVLAGAHHDVLALGRQRAQQLLRVLVRAVLAPQQRVHRQLDLVRRPALLLADSSYSARVSPSASASSTVGSAALSGTRALDASCASTRRSSARRPSRRSARRPRARGGASARTRCPARCSRPRCRAASR